MTTIAQMRPKLLTLDQARETLAKTEPLGETFVDGDSTTRFRFDPEWAFTLDTTHGTDPVNATVSIDGVEHQLTKDAVFTAASAFGLPATHAKQLPAHLMEQEMNYWFAAGIGKQAFNVLTFGTDRIASAFVKPSKRSFSNLALLDSIESRILERLGHTEVLVDYKLAHSITSTDVRLILPEILHQITDTDVDDDQWSAGIHLSNSLIARGQTSVEPYLFRWTCTNGATTQYSAEDTWQKWNRKNSGQDQDKALAWARAAVDEVFDGLPKKWVELQKLTALNIESNAGEIIREVFKTYGVPVTQQNEIISELLETDNLTMYALMQSITQLANNPHLKPERSDVLMRIGGSIPTALFDPLNRKLWDEGHTADPNAKNPYLVAA